MSIHISKWAAALLTTFISCNALAEVVTPRSAAVISVNVGSTDTSGTYGFSGGESAQEVDLDYESGIGLALGWGVEDGNARFMLEYYHARADIDSPPFAVSNGSPRLEIQSLFYSGYWVPDIYWGIKGILGAGVGYSRQTLDNAALGKLSDHGWSFKASAGLEYAVINNLSVYVLAEGLFHDEIEDRVSYTAEGSTTVTNAERAIDGSEQLRFGLGINLRY